MTAAFHARIQMNTKKHYDTMPVGAAVSLPRCLTSQLTNHCNFHPPRLKCLHYPNLNLPLTYYSVVVLLLVAYAHQTLDQVPENTCPNHLLTLRAVKNASRHSIPGRISFSRCVAFPEPALIACRKARPNLPVSPEPCLHLL